MKSKKPENSSKAGSKTSAPAPAPAAAKPAAAQPQIDIQDPQPPTVPDVPVPDVPEINMTQPPLPDDPTAPEPQAEPAPAADAPAPAPPPLTAQEQRIVDAVIAHIDPLLVKLKEIADQADATRASQSQEQSAHDYEALLDQMSQQMNQRIERKIAHLQTFIAKRG